MISDAELQELIDFQGDDAPVLSLYLDVDPQKCTKEEYRLALRKLMKQVADQAAPEDIARIERYIDLEYDWQGKAVALFSCGKAGLWRSYSLAVPIEDQVFVYPRPYVKPLTDLLGRYAPYGVILIGREGARLLRVRLGEVEDSLDALGEETKRHKKGGWAASRYQRHVDEQAQHNLKAVADLAADFFQPPCRLLIGGTEETVAQFKPLLSRALQDLVIASFPMDITASDLEVLSKSLELVEEADREEEERLVQQVITLANKGEAGALGLEDTLAAVQEERVHILIVSDDYRAPGHRCGSCGYVTATAAKKCRYCGGALTPVSDVVEFAVERIVERGGKVEVVRGNAALKEAGGIGAILRY
jgi:peptide chain release factor subunit 1